MLDLEQTWERLLAMSHRQQQAFGYHIAEDGLPVWDGEDVPDNYTSDQYAKEQHP